MATATGLFCYGIRLSAGRFFMRWPPLAAAHAPGDGPSGATGYLARR
jgi:hypothetical protein